MTQKSSGDTDTIVVLGAACLVSIVGVFASILF